MGLVPALVHALHPASRRRPLAQPRPDQLNLRLWVGRNAGQVRKLLLKRCSPVGAFDHGGDAQCLQAEKTVAHRRHEVREQGLRGAVARSNLGAQIPELVVVVEDALLHLLHDRCVFREALELRQFRPQPHLQFRRRQQNRGVHVVQAHREARDLRQAQPSSNHQRPQDVPGGVHLEVRSEAGRHLARIGERQDLATLQRREGRRGLRACRLNLQLLAQEHLKWLIAFGLVILDGGVLVIAGLLADAAAPIDAGGRRAMHVIVFVVHRTSSGMRRREVDPPASTARRGIVHLKGPQVKIASFAELLLVRCHQEHVDRRQRLDLSARHAKGRPGFIPDAAGRLSVVRVAARVRRAANAAGEELQHARAAAADFPRLRVELANHAALLGLEHAAFGVQARPQAAKPAEEGVHATWQQARIIGAPAGVGGQGREVRHGEIRDRRRHALEDVRAEFADRLSLSHRVVHQERQRRVVVQGEVEG